MRAIGATATRLVITAAILAYLASRVDLREAGSVLLSVDPVWFAVTLVLVALDRVTMALRWLLLLRAVGVALSARETFRVFLVSSFVGSFLPAGVGADLSRAYTVATRTAQGSQAVASIGVDRVLGQMALVLLGAAGIAGWAQQLGPGIRWQLSVVAVVVGVTSLAVLWMDQFVRLALPARWHTTKWGWRVRRLGEAVGEYRRQPTTLALVFVLSVVVQMLRIFQAYCLGRGMSIEVGLVYYAVIISIALLLMQLPVSISGFGLPQGVIVWLLDPVGVPRADAFALSTMIVLLGPLGNLPGAFLYLARRRSAT